MNEAMRLEIVQRRQSEMSMRAIAVELGISRGAVARVLAHVRAQRDGQASPFDGGQRWRLSGPLLAVA
jgi:IS30 family transposase